MSDKNQDILNKLFEVTDQETIETIKSKAKEMSEKSNYDLIQELKKVQKENNIDIKQMESFKESLQPLLDEEQKDKLDKIIELLKDK
ncbi:MAG: hypothetical protein PHP06_10140 [Clostridia bacterium]|nr:hypothetical protein [Clostridia bacterium]